MHSASLCIHVCINIYRLNTGDAILLLPSYKTRKEHYMLLLNCAKVAAAPKASVAHADDGEGDDPARAPWKRI